MHHAISDGMISHYVHLDSYTDQIRNLTHFRPKAILCWKILMNFSSITVGVIWLTD